MTMAQSLVLDCLFWVLVITSVLYERPWRRDIGARPDAPGDVSAALFIEVVLTLCLMVIVVGYVVVLITVWSTPDGQRPAPTWRYWELAFVVAWVVIGGLVLIRRYLRRLWH